MATQEPVDWKEGRRLRAYELKQAGWSQDQIAKALGVSKGAVSKWMARARAGGVAGLLRRPAPGAASRLSAEQLAGLPSVLAKGAEAYGFRGAVWTRERVRDVIAAVYGVRYHIDHMSYLMKKIGWSRQKPGRRAVQQAAWPEVEKSRTAWADDSFSDEAGFKLLSGVVATDAPVGQTPVLVPLRYDRLSVMGALSNAGDLLTWTLDRPVKEADLVRFLKHVLNHSPADILLVWDGLPAHRSQPVKDFLKTPEAKRLTLLQLPPYASDLNPQEGIWRSLKYVELANLCCHDLDELRLALRRAIQRLRYHLNVIWLFGQFRGEVIRPRKDKIGAET